MNIKIAREKIGSVESNEWIAEFVDSRKSCKGSSVSEALGKLVRKHMAEFGIDAIQFGHDIPIESFSFGPGLDPESKSYRRVTA